MKVALLTDCYLPRLGGIEVQVHDLARELIAAGHEVTVVCITPGSPEPVDGVPVVRHALNLPFGLLVNPMAASQVRRMLAEDGFDVAHVHMGVVSPFAMDCVRICIDLGVPAVVTWHCVLAGVGPLVRALGYVGRWDRAGVLLTAVSDVAAQRLRPLAPGAQISVLPNAIDPSRWLPGTHTEVDGSERADASRTTEAGPVVRVVTAMRLARRKRPLHLLRVVQEARRLSGIDLRLEILGEGPQRPSLERWSAQHDAHGWLSLPGRMLRAELHQRYLTSDIYVSPAKLEAFGIAALEARATGLPVVGPRSSGITEFITDEVNGLLVSDDHEMALALARLATDTALRQRISEHNASTPIAQDWSGLAALTVATYQEAVGQRAAVS